MGQCNIFWGSHGCDRKAGHGNPLCKCGNHSFLDAKTGTVLSKSEIKQFLDGDRAVGVRTEWWSMIIPMVEV